MVQELGAVLSPSPGVSEVFEAVCPKRSSGISHAHGIFSVGLGSCKNLDTEVVPDGKVPPVVWGEVGSDPQHCWGVPQTG